MELMHDLPQETFVTVFHLTWKIYSRIPIIIIPNVLSLSVKNKLKIHHSTIHQSFQSTLEPNLIKLEEVTTLN